ncbi:hypothetical protein TBLA_0F01910 [Henningerozyma blattae CBS 6284]|uniref:Coatomer subunit epsilon n=1 Tax=Henningerozyma blattae (strain ATCC 34711 / CBS 6284 / DSM 70876 / NBRC 10599 / NRRL Y-10934 / UCD 77-7) TaxID=1071380 RepID=I2H5T1_HENB6|nr:hypothetical protein TBLA_0F01910 [Tetrapisispora blattae CBS 6284]CCH61733.1 hypothetical protein TBLA_0F01910 [Tetrapisispora blattae CBS 6284]
MDYFRLKQTYYTGEYKQALKEIESLPVDDTTLFYKGLTLITLSKYETLTSSSTEHNDLIESMDLYSKFIKDKKLIKDLESKIELSSSKPFQLFLLASAKAINREFDESLNICVAGIDGDETLGVPELLLLAIEVSLLNDQPSVAKTMYDNYTNNFGDQINSENELILNLAESYIKFVTHKDTTTSNFYYFEELAQSFPTWLTQLSLLNLHLQQKNVIEAEQIISTLESDYYSKEQKDLAAIYYPNLLTAKIILSSMKAKYDNINDLREELKKVDPNNSYIKEHDQLNLKFDEVVAKYSSL